MSVTEVVQGCTLTNAAGIACGPVFPDYDKAESYQSFVSSQGAKAYTTTATKPRRKADRPPVQP